MIARIFARIVALWTAWRAARLAHEDRMGDDPAGLGAGAGHPADPEDPSRRDIPANRRAETWVARLLVLAACFGFAFTAIYVALSDNTQLLGVAIGGMFALLAAAAIIAGKAVVVQETSVEDRGTLLHEEAPVELTEMLVDGGEGVSRRGLLTGAAGLAGAAATTAAITPLASLGPRLTEIHHVPWRRGVRFVDTTGLPFLASDIEVRSFYTALPEGKDQESLGAGLIVLRLPESMIDLPPARRSWAPQGIMAFSKICPHAACAISLYRYPQFPSAGNAEPALTCPCHYSTFLPGQGGRLLFGPAGRPLPQLPVMIDAEGHLRAAGGFDEDIGPSWLDVRRPRSE